VRERWVTPVVSVSGDPRVVSRAVPVYASLTSIFDNQNRLARTLQSILDQTRPPNRIFLHLSEESHLKDAGFPGRRITDEGLASVLENNGDRVEVHWVPNTGPYRKLLPTLEELVRARNEERFVVVTFDDDLEYHPGVISSLLSCDAPASCLRGFEMDLDGAESLAHWDYFRRRPLPEGTSLVNFSTGVGSVLYTRAVFEGLYDALLDSSIYLECCPTNDDIWFNFLRIANGVALTVVAAPYVARDLTNRETALWSHFNYAGNNQQIRATAARLNQLGLL